MPEPIILYDIPCKSTLRKAFSPSTWKTRFSLQYKGLLYRTEWVEFPDIKDIAIKPGVKPNVMHIDGKDVYTLPMIYDPNTDTFLGDSLKIARYLDEAYPDTPKLFPDNTQAFHAAVEELWWPKMAYPLFWTVISSCCNVLNERSQVYYRETREKWFGKKLEDIPNEEHWKNAEEGFGKLAAWLDQNGRGKNLLFLGDKISFADIQVASLLMWAKVCFGEDSEEWGRILGWHGGKWKAISEHFQKYETDT